MIKINKTKEVDEDKYNLIERIVSDEDFYKRIKECVEKEDMQNG